MIPSVNSGATARLRRASKQRTDLITQLVCASDVARMGARARAQAGPKLSVSDSWAAAPTYEKGAWIDKAAMPYPL